MAFSREVREISTRTVEILYPLHEIDSYNGEEMKTFIENTSDFDAVVVNFSRVNYLNSSGLRELLQLLKYLKNEGKLLFLTHLTDDIFKIFKSTNLHRLFKICESEEESCLFPEG
jgi:anti-sigma B factor antagonist